VAGSSACRQRRLRECIRLILNEDDGGDYGGDFAMGGGMSPYGMHFGSDKDLLNVFVKPFTDVVATAAGKTKEISKSGQNLLRTSFEAIATTVLPMFKDSYERIFAEEKNAIDKIRNEYADVYKSNWDAFQKNDALCVAFAYRPDLFLDIAAVKKAPKVAAKMLSVLSGGRLDNILAKLLRAPTAAPAHKSSKNKKYDMGGGVDFGEGFLHEDDESDNDNPLVKLVTNKKVKEVIASNPRVVAMGKEAKGIVRATLSKAYKQVQAVSQAKSVEDLQRILKKPIEGADKLGQLQPQERQAAEANLVKTLKQSIKNFYIKNLEAQAKSAVDQGVPQNHPYVNDYQSVVAKIKTL
jgi:hypothetical protein